jgi:hypothetical protein
MLDPIALEAYWHCQAPKGHAHGQRLGGVHERGSRLLYRDNISLQRAVHGRRSGRALSPRALLLPHQHAKSEWEA